MTIILATEQMQITKEGSNLVVFLKKSRLLEAGP